MLPRGKKSNKLSSEKLANILPVELKIIYIIIASCFVNVFISFLRFTSHNLILLSEDPLANRFPFELKSKH